MDEDIIETAWYVIGILTAVGMAVFLLVWGVHTILLAPETEYINCQPYKHVDDLVICQERPVEGAE